MTTNSHILTIDTYLGQMRALVCALPQSAEKEQLMELVSAMTDKIFCAQTDFADLHHQIAELHRQLFEPVIRAQMGIRCRYIETQDQLDFIAQKDTALGKKTMRAYLWKVCGDEYDAQHPQG